MSRISFARLLTLADYLTTVPQERFNMAYWGQGTIKASYPECGFTGCAMGHAAFIPAFRAAGLHLVRVEKAGERGSDYDRHEPRFKRFREMRAAEAFFRLERKQAISLFGGENSQGKDREETPKQVAARIRRFVTRLK